MNKPKFYFNDFKKLYTTANISLLEIAKATKIKVKNLEKLEKYKTILSSKETKLIFNAINKKANFQFNPIEEISPEKTEPYRYFIKNFTQILTDLNIKVEDLIAELEIGQSVFKRLEKDLAITKSYAEKIFTFLANKTTLEKDNILIEEVFFFNAKTLRNKAKLSIYALAGLSNLSQDSIEYIEKAESYEGVAAENIIKLTDTLAKILPKNEETQWIYFDVKYPELPNTIKSKGSKAQIINSTSLPTGGNDPQESDSPSENIDDSSDSA